MGNLERERERDYKHESTKPRLEFSLRRFKTEGGREGGRERGS